MRLPYQCVHCGLRLAGKLGKDGRVHAHDKLRTAIAAAEGC